MNSINSTSFITILSAGSCLTTLYCPVNRTVTYDVHHSFIYCQLAEYSA